MPRWFVAAGVAGSVLIVVALLRFAVDLLGLVSIIVLVGFSIRALTDWLTDTDAVSVWSLAAVLAGAMGTAATGLWLFGNGDLTGVRRVEQRLPPGLARAISWAEERGWGGRVLLPDARPRGSAGGVAMPAPSTHTAPPSAARGGRGAAGGSALPADGGAAAGGSPAPSVRQPPDADGDRRTTATRLTITPVPGRGATAVRLTAVVTARFGGGALPDGTVVFRRGTVIVGSSVLRQEGGAAIAELTADLPAGEHEMVAEYVGSGAFRTSQSSVVTRTVARD